MGISNLPKINDLIGMYVPSTIQGTQWKDLYGSNNTMTINSAWSLNKNWQYLKHDALDAEGITMNTTGFMDTVKSIVIVYNFNSTTAKNSIIYSDGTAGNFVSPRVDGYVWDVVPAGSEVYFDGVQSNSSHYSALSKQPGLDVFDDKWTVVILNKQRLSSWAPILKFFQYIDYPDYSPAVGTKVAAIGVYNQDLTASEIHDITHWGKSRFGNLV